MPGITEQFAWAEASHVILLISGSDYFLIKAEFKKKKKKKKKKKSALSQRPGLNSKSWLPKFEQSNSEAQALKYLIDTPCMYMCA